MLAIVALLAVVIWGFTRTLPVLRGAPGLSPVEGPVIEMGRRALRGENPYPDPVTDRAVAFLYPPLGPCLLAVGFNLTGDLTGARAVSFAAVIASAVALGLHLRARNGWRAGVIAALAWLGVLNTFCGYFFLARVDAVAVFFLLTALCAGARAAASGGERGLVFAAVLAAAALLCKQTAAAVVVGVGVGFLRKSGPGAAIRYLSIVGAVTGTVLLTLHFASSGWSTRFLWLPSGHPFQRQEFVLAIGRLVSIDSVMILTLAAFGLRRDELAWNVSTVLTAALSLVTASKWGGLTTALAPLYLLLLGTSGVERVGAAARDATLRLVSAFLALFLPLAITGARVPQWGVADTGPVVEELLARAGNTTRALSSARGRLLVNGTQDYALLAGRSADDDLHAALECDLGGYAVLTRLAAALERREYAVVVGSASDLAARAGEVLGARPETAARLEACARALAEHYVEATPPDALTQMFVPKP